MRDGMAVKKRIMGAVEFGKNKDGFGTIDFVWRENLTLGKSDGMIFVKKGAFWIKEKSLVFKIVYF